MLLDQRKMNKDESRRLAAVVRGREKSPGHTSAEAGV